MTTPYLYTDLLSPNSLQNSVEDGEGLIRTWSDGSPLKAGQTATGSGKKKASPIAKSYESDFQDEELDAYLANLNLVTAQPQQEAEAGNHSGVGVDNLRGVMMPSDYQDDTFYSQEQGNDGMFEYAQEEEEEVEGDVNEEYYEEEEEQGEAAVDDDDDDLDNYIEYEGSDAHIDPQEQEEEGVDGEEGDEEDGQKEEHPEAVFSAMKDFNDMFDDPSRFHTSYDSVLRFGDFGKEIGLDKDGTIAEEDDEEYGQVLETADYDQDVGFEQEDEGEDDGEDEEEEDEEDGEEGEEDDDEDDDEEDGEEEEEEELDPEQADDGEINKIVNDYTELLSYMDSPRAKDKKFMEDNLNIMIRSRNIIQAQPKQPSPSKPIMQAQPSQPDFANILLPTKKKDKKKAADKKAKQKKDQGRSTKSSNYGNTNNNKKGKKKGPVDKAAMREVAMRHKAMLANLSNKRKQDEEELQQLVQQEQDKRKKFRENLLEKAMKARKEQNQNGEDDRSEEEDERLQSVIPKMPKLPEKITKKKKDPSAPPPVAQKQGSHTALPVSSSLLQPTTAYKNQSVVKTAHEVILTDEQLAQQEEAKREYIAMIRRKFKEQHKKILAQLAAKKKEEEDKTEQEQLVEEQKRLMRKKKLLKMLADKPPAPQPEPVVETQPSAPGGSGRKSRSAAAFLTQKDQAAADDTPTGKGRKAAGSGLAVVRQRSSQLHQSSSASSGRRQRDDDASGSGSDSEVVSKAASASKAQRPPQASTSAKAQPVVNNKLQEYLQNISEQRKQEELAKKKMEDRQKKRIQLLSQRLLQEAAERKLMVQEDKAKYRDTASNKDDAPVEKKAKKITAEQADAITNRLRGQQKPAAETPANNVSSSAAEKPTKKLPPRPSVERVAVSTTSEGAALSTKENKEVTFVSGAPARDFNDWKRKNGVPADGKVFCMTGWYPCVKQALLDRGWHFNPDPASPYFHLKWTLRSIDVNQDSLQPWQLTNHYLKNVAITTKAGLIKSLQSLVWLADVDSADIIPRAYDLSINHEMRAFLDDFRGQKAEAMLKKLYHTLTGRETAVEVDKLKYYSGSLSSRRASSRQASSRAVSAGNTDIAEKSSTFYDAEVELEQDSDEKVIPPTPALADGVDLTSIQINAVVFEACCHLLESLLRPVDDDFLDDDAGQLRATSQLDQSLMANEKVISDLDWELVSNYSLYSSAGSLPFDTPEPVDQFLRGKEDEYQELPSGKATTASAYQQQQTQQQITREKKKLQKLYEELRDDASNNIRQMRSVTIADLERVHKILSKLHYFHGNQFGINGKAPISENIWIVKPAAKSRGRGITTFNDLPKLLKYVDAGAGLSTQWIVQKYMENPLTIAKRKFDLRQWVLVTDWNPLTIYFYNECYARFSVEEYSIDNQKLDNCFIHLVNNSIGKNSEHFGRVITAENGKDIEGCMWSYDDFKEYVIFQSGKDLVTNKIMPRMKDIAKWSLMCASEMIEHRKNSWELYGFDYMVDDDYNAWLIEINSSPACDYSTKVTERYVQKALVELLSVVLDVRDWEAQPKKTRGDKPDTGDWECIYQGQLLDMPMGHFGTDMSLKGEGLKTLRPKPAGYAPSANVSFGNPPSVDPNEGPTSTSFKRTNEDSSSSSSSRRPQAGGISYHVSDNAAAKKPNASNPPYGMKREDSVQRRVAPVDRRPSLTAEEPADDGNFDDSDEDSVKKAKQVEKKIPSENEFPSSGQGSRRDRNAIASNKAAAKTSHTGAIPANSAAIPVKVFSVDF